jgi:flavin-dependent dehydrogenase
MAVGRRGYVGLVRLEDGGLNVAAAFADDFMKERGGPAGAAVQVLEEAGFELPEGLESADWQGTLPLTRRTRPIAGERFFVVGDAAGYVEPFTGEGMAWAIRAGLDVTPLAEQAVSDWDPHLAGEWGRIHWSRVYQGQRLCRGVAALLRRPWLARAAFVAADCLPWAAGFVIRHAGGTTLLRQPS